ncbi:MAG: 2-succinyl-5-enolpyruvyl-6-hydroxy-3-cyclohexene-carboxylate synthase [Actinomycetota bacterium]|nr:2-succinyl-5-enolpyruvyl-6-hydroxy-3-cyclohexene-carboxylate synthase [Actinomycetota bacterium]
MDVNGEVQAAFAHTLVDEWVRGGVSDAVVAPGSRSTPLAMALITEGRMRVHVIVDERSAAFFALGLGLATGRPAVVLTTSGTAAVELHPAIVEAHHAGVPLIACTADRPPALQGIGAPQTIDQSNLFPGVLRFAAAPGLPTNAGRGTWRSLAARAVLEATAGPDGPGPVHLNLAFDDPLVAEPAGLAPGRASGGPWHVAARRHQPPPDDVVDFLLAASARGVIVAGAGAGDPAAVHAAAAALGWPVLADPRSGCRIPAVTTVAAADALLRSPSFVEAHRPEAVLRLGAPWASKVLSQALAEWDVPVVHVDPFGRWLDPERVATRVVHADPTAVCEAVAAKGASDRLGTWAESWAASESSAQAGIDAALADIVPITEPWLARVLVAQLPDGAALVTSSSMPVRDIEWYSRPRTGLKVLANRGANGIDGVVSTALGVAASHAGPTVALVGDLAFLHDTNGLLAINGTAAGLDCTIVVVDNDGGGIFSFLPQATEISEPRFERLFGTPHGLDLATVAAAHGAPAYRVDALPDFLPTVDAAMAAGGVRVVHVRTDRRLNVSVHQRIHDSVAAVLSARSRPDTTPDPTP